MHTRIRNNFRTVEDRTWHDRATWRNWRAPPDLRAARIKRADPRLSTPFRVYSSVALHNSRRALDYSLVGRIRYRESNCDCHALNTSNDAVNNLRRYARQCCVCKAIETNYDYSFDHKSSRYCIKINHSGDNSLITVIIVVIIQ